MRLYLPWLSCAVLALAGARAASAPATPPRKDQINYVRSSELKISFNYNAANSGDKPIEVQLHVSRDRGNTWVTAQKTPPEAKHFIFRAPKDGEYWFMPRTKYQSGKYLPVGPPQAEAKAIVDTTAPSLELTAVRGEGGEVHVRWNLSDANLAPATFRIEYQIAGNNPGWQKVAADPLTPGEPGAPLAGETTFVPQGRPRFGAITVRAEIADLAGNQTVAERPVAADDSARFAAEAGASKPSQNEAAEEQVGPRMSPDEPFDAPPEMADQFPGDLPARGNQFPVIEGDSPYPKTNTPDWPPRPAEPGDAEADSRPAPQTVQDDVQPAVGNRYPAETAPELPPANAAKPPANAGLPPGVRPHMVNKRRFELLYDVESVGSAGVAQIELWGSRDGGQTWNTFGVDEDGRSPMVVNVDGEGVYGFRMVVTTGAGATGPVPASGDLPDVWVGVDETKPVGNLISAEQGHGDEADEIVVAWEADDEQLAARPISLRMSESRDGPWHTIASGLENTGRYAWRIDPRVPEKAYLRLEVRDEAGNVRIDDSTDPIEIQQVRPQGKIHDVRPFGEARRRARTTHNFRK